MSLGNLDSGLRPHPRVALAHCGLTRSPLLGVEPESAASSLIRGAQPQEQVTSSPEPGICHSGHTHTYTQIHTDRGTCTYRYTCVRTHSQIETHTDMWRHTRRQTCRRARTHTHTLSHSRHPLPTCHPLHLRSGPKRHLETSLGTS